MPYLGIALPDLLRLAQSHLFLSGCAVGLALLLGLPIAIIAARHPPCARKNPASRPAAVDPIA